MNRVGREGRGESVWMGFFLAAVIDAFAPLVEARGDRDRARRYRRHRDALADRSGRRRLGRRLVPPRLLRRRHPAGHAGDSECRIDALVQAWAVLSRVAPPARAAQALDAVEEHLISREDGLIRLLTPPFVDTPHDPGYIKGYVAGVRENGGQYTHAALWVVRALAEAGRRDRAAAARPCSARSPARRPPTRSRATRSNRTSWRPTSTAPNRTSGAAAGRGTPARRAGCCGWRWSRCSA
jgi:N,N'-diacetylchitobiose phosphorylase